MGPSKVEAIGFYLGGTLAYLCPAFRMDGAGPDAAVSPDAPNHASPNHR